MIYNRQQALNQASNPTQPPGDEFDSVEHLKNHLKKVVAMEPDKGSRRPKTRFVTSYGVDGSRQVSQVVDVYNEQPELAIAAGHEIDAQWEFRVERSEVLSAIVGSSECSVESLRASGKFVPGVR